MGGEIGRTRSSEGVPPLDQAYPECINLSRRSRINKGIELHNFKFIFFDHLHPGKLPELRFPDIPFYSHARRSPSR